MLAVIRQSIPATRSLSDGRLLALVLAVGMLVMAAADATSVGMAVGVAVMLAVFHRQRSCGRSSRCAVETAADEVAAVVTEVATDVTETAPAEDPLVARARALRERTASRF